jgi:hypothetical protein
MFYTAGSPIYLMCYFVACTQPEPGKRGENMTPVSQIDSRVKSVWNASPLDPGRPAIIDRWCNLWTQSSLSESAWRSQTTLHFPFRVRKAHPASYSILSLAIDGKVSDDLMQKAGSPFVKPPNIILALLDSCDSHLFCTLNAFPAASYVHVS